MKGIAFLAAFFPVLTGASMACVRVDVREPPQPSLKNAKITVLDNGNPAGGIRLTVRLSGKEGRRSVQTDSRGTATITDLPEGTTWVTAFGEGLLTSRLCLAVPARATNEVSSFYMALAPGPLWPLSPEDKVDTLEQSPPTARVASLKGTILDPLGELIPGAEVRVYKRGTYPQNPVAVLKTNERGQFAASLEPAIYTVIFRTRGFRTEFIGLEIRPDGGDQELRETLQLASDCDS